MAKVLGYNLQQLDVLEGGYYPQGLMDMELEQQAVRRALIEVLSGRRPLAVSPGTAIPPAPFPFPPPPATTGVSPPTAIATGLFPPPPKSKRGN